MFLETHESMLLSATNEINQMEFHNTSSYFSFIIAWLILGVGLALPVIGFYYFWTKRHNFDPNKNFVFMEYFADIQDSKFARIYMPILLTRRIAFI
mmetsp:Transcript_20278/g.17958  ORF Transcript_20278/g.17958 Transcript_20278/m.17958 type:complete len:96 (-) Transcript_20278:862-1149(-)